MTPSGTPPDSLISFTRESLGMTSSDDQEPRTVDLTDTQWRVLNEIRAHRIPTEVAEAWGVSRQDIDNTRRRLEHLGAIIRREDTPWWTKHTEHYPWVLADDIIFRYKPALPPDAKFDSVYPIDSTTKRVVAPIRMVHWGDWVIQGLPTFNPDSTRRRSRAPTHRIVWCVDLTDGDSEHETAFIVPLRFPWAESDTDNTVNMSLCYEELTALTLIIAAVAGVDAVLDITKPVDRATGTGTAIDGEVIT